MQKRIFVFLVIMGLIFSITLSTLAAEKVARFGHGNEPGGPRDKAAHLFADRVAELTDGMIKVEVYASAALGSDEEMVQQLKDNISQFAAPGVGTISPEVPVLNVLEMPFLFEDFEQAWNFLDSPIVKKWVAPFPDKGYRVLAFWENGFRNMTNNLRPIEKPEDLKGLKIRVPNWEMSIATFDALGAQVTPMAFPEVYMALQQGVIDGQENPFTVIYVNNFYEVQKFLSITRHQYSPLPLLVSEDFWQSLSPKEQNAIKQAAEEAKKYHREAIKNQEADLLSKLEDEGMKVNYPDMDPFREKASVVYEKYADEYGDALKQVQEFIKN